MKALVIYDSTGYIWNIVYGEESVPEGLEKSAMIVEIPTDERLLSIDVSDVNNPTPVFDAQPDTQIDRLAKLIDTVQSEASDTAKTATQNTSDITDMQVAIAELYEATLS